MDGRVARDGADGGSTASPSAADPVVRALSEVAGGPVGRHGGGAAVAARFAAPSVVVLVSAATAVLGVALLLRQHCRTTLWASPDQFTHACYSDLPPLYASAGVADGLLPYVEAVGGVHLAQPVGTGALLWVLGLVAPGGADALRWYFDVAVLLLVVALAVTVACTARLAGRRRWDAALVALSPVILTSSLVSLDLVAVALTVGAALAFARSRTLTAGALLGLAVSVRPTALVLGVAIGLLALRTGRGAASWRVLAGGLVTWALVNVPVLLLSWDGWTAYWRAVWEAAVSYGSLLLLPQLAATGLSGGPAPRPPAWFVASGLVLIVAAALVARALPAEARRRWLPRRSTGLVVAAVGVAVLPAVLALAGPLLLDGLSRVAVAGTTGRWVSLALSVLVLVGVTLFTLSTPRRPRLPVVVLLLLVGLFTVSPSLPVQSALWLLPFAALAVPSWRPLLVWGAAEAAYATGTWLYLYGLSVPDRGLPAWAYAVLTVLRVLAALWLAWRAVDLSRHPESDPVRVGGRDGPGGVAGRDDPAAGPLEDAPDAVVVGFR